MYTCNSLFSALVIFTLSILNGPVHRLHKLFFHDYPEASPALTRQKQPISCLLDLQQAARHIEHSDKGTQQTKMILMYTKNNVCSVDE